MSEVLANNSPPVYLPQIGRATPAGVARPTATAPPRSAALPALPGPLAKHGELGLHLLFWTLYLVYPLAKSGGHPNQPFNYPFTALQTGTSLLPVYAFYLLLLPRLFAARQYGWLGLAGLVLATSFAALSCYLNHAFLTECKCSLQLCILNTTPEKASLLLFFGAVFVFKEHHRKQKELEHLEKERLGAELGYLRAQVNPHYLFNTLNTIYSCSLDKSAKVPELLLKLSKNLRYVLYDSEQDQVKLEQEIQHLDDYIALQQLRLEGRVQVHFSVGGFVAGQTIAPLLLIAFVENAFKYCTEYPDRESEITISIAIEGSRLHFQCENDCDTPGVLPASTGQHAEGGIGLKNVRKRLLLAYGSHQHLHITKAAGKFRVDLLIDPL